MTNEIKLIYLLTLKENLNLAEIAGKEGWQPIIYTMVSDWALKLEHHHFGTIALVTNTHRFIRDYLILRDGGGSRKKPSQNNQ
jgi:hypothetical protein